MHKYYTPDDWLEFAKQHPKAVPFAACSAGTAEGDFDRLSAVLKSIPEIQFICLDVANGYSEHFVDHVKRVRAAFPAHTIMVRLSQSRNLQA